MLEIRLPLKAESTANLREHWAVKAKRTKTQRAAVARRLPPWPGGPLLVVRLTRISPRMLDSGDNLSMSLKGFRDSVASRLKIDDASPLVEWEYHQARGEAEVVVQIWKAGEADPSLPVGRPAERKRPLLPSERVSKALRNGVPGVVAAVAAEAGQKRAPRRKEAPTEALAFARALNTQPNHTKPNNSKGREFYGQIGKPPFAVRVESSGYDPDKAAMERATTAASEAQETFAPAACAPSSPCGRCIGCLGSIPG